MKKKILSLVLTGTLMTGLVGCVSKGEEKEITEVNEDKVKITLVTDVAGVNDLSFNQSAWEGAKKAKEELGVEVSFIEPKQESDYLQSIETAVDNGSDLVVGVGFNLADDMLEASKAFPDTKFLMVDATYDEIPKNMTTITYDEEQSGYLAGLVIGKMTDKEVTKFGFVGGMDIPTVTQFAVGYEKALKEINPKNELKVQIANSFTDQAKGKAIANQMYKEGIETIFTAGGGVNTGVFESAKELGKCAVGVDSPCSHLSPNQIITSALKNIDVGVYNSIEALLSEGFKGGENTIYDLTNGGVGYEKTKLIPQDVIDFVDSKIK